MKTPEWVHSVGRRGGFFLIIGTVFALIGVANIGTRSSMSATQLENLTVLTKVLPLETWYFVWGLVGATCIASAFWKKLEPLASGAASFISMTWCLGYVAAYIQGLGHRAWSGAMTYLLIVLLVQLINGWPEPTRNSRDSESPRRPEV